VVADKKRRRVLRERQRRLGAAVFAAVRWLVTVLRNRKETKMNTPSTTTTQTPITVGTRIVVAAGCKALDIAKNVTGQVTAITALGADYSHSVKIELRWVNGFKAGKSRVLFARHINRLGDATVNLNDGNPLHKITIRRA
jgi:hypothetical protein